MAGKTKQRSRKRNDLEEIGFAMDFLHSGGSMVVGSDFVMKSRNPFNADIGHLDPKDLRKYDQKFIDNLSSFKADDIAIPFDMKTLYQEYKEKRIQLGKYHEIIFRNLPENDIDAAKELGNFDPYISRIVFRNDSEINIFFDYIALYRMLGGKRAVVHWNLVDRKMIKNKYRDIAFSVLLRSCEVATCSFIYH